MTVSFARHVMMAGSIVTIAVAAPSFAVIAQAGSAVRPAIADGSGMTAMRLAASIKSEISAQPATASAADLEGFIVFALSQGDYPIDMIDAALTQVDQMPGATDALHEAVANARRALKRRVRGTSAVASRGGGSGGGGGGAGVFSAPVSGGGGGSSNYSS